MGKISSESKKQTQLSAQQINHTFEKPGFFSNVWQGVAVGTGQSIAMNMFRSPTQVNHTYDIPQNSQSTYDACIKDGYNKEACTLYNQCITKHDVGICRQHLTYD